MSENCLPLRRKACIAVLSGAFYFFFSITGCKQKQGGSNISVLGSSTSHSENTGNIRIGLVFIKGHSHQVI